MAAKTMMDKNKMSFSLMAKDKMSFLVMDKYKMSHLRDALTLISKCFLALRRRFGREICDGQRCNVI